MSAELYCGDALEVLRTLPDGSARCCVCSPPYWGLRDYGTAEWEGGDPGCDHLNGALCSNRSTLRGYTSETIKLRTNGVPYRDNCGKCGARRIDRQLGLEATPEEYVARMVAVFREVRRVLTDDGTLWLNLGDSYAQAGGPGWQGKNGQRADRRFTASRDTVGMREIGRAPPLGLKPKDLVGIPWRLAFALQADGWVLRSEIVWNKPNPMPESVTDRPTKSHEQVFLLSKAKWSGPRPGRFAHVRSEDARWLAALIDCEGSIVVKRGKVEGRCDVYAPQVSIGNTSRELIERVAAIVGHGSTLRRPGKNAPMFYWQVAHAIAADFLRLVYPHLVVKHRQARIGVYVDSLVYWRGGKKLERKQRTATEDALLKSLWQRNKECNHFGVPDLSDVPGVEYGRWTAGERYFYDAAAIADEAEYGRGIGTEWSRVREGDPRDGRKGEKPGTHINPPKQDGHGRRHAGLNARWDEAEANGSAPRHRNARTVWTIATQPYPEAHFATFPEELARRCIVAGSAPGDVVLDPFGGSGTVAAVAVGNGRRSVYIDLNPAYLELARQRIGPMLCRDSATSTVIQPAGAAKTGPPDESGATEGVVNG